MNFLVKIWDFIRSIKIECGCKACSYQYKMSVPPIASIPSVINNKKPCGGDCKNCKCKKP